MMITCTDRIALQFCYKVLKKPSANSNRISLCITTEEPVMKLKKNIRYKATVVCLYRDGTES